MVCLFDIKDDFNWNSCARDFDLLAITDVIGFSFQGILGISPSYDGEKVPSLLQ